MKKDIKCPLCESKEIHAFLNRKDIPVLQNVPFMNKELAISINKENMKIYHCENCDFVFNGIFKEVSYSEGYINSQENSKIFNEHVEQILTLISNHIIEKYKDKGVTAIVEAGCGQGKFIRKLVNKMDELGYKEYCAYGFDPAYIETEILVENQKVNNDIIFKAEYFNKNSLNDVKCDNLVVIARHVIEHISKPVNFVDEIKSVMFNLNGEASLIVETPTVNWILKRGAFEDFYYEHCSYFNDSSLRYLFEKNMFKINTIKEIFNGQYIIAIGDLCLHNNKEIFRYIKDEEKKINFYKGKIQNNKRSVIWGAGAKGVLFANLLDSDCKYILAVVDINPDKQGKFLAGTGHEIIAPEKILELNINQIIVMNENYYQEICIQVKNIFKNCNFTPEMVKL